MTGVNARICETLGISNARILVPKHNLLKKLVTYVPVAQAEQVRKALVPCRGRPYWRLQRVQL
jgi:hypothetical protein